MKLAERDIEAFSPGQLWVDGDRIVASGDLDRATLDQLRTILETHPAATRIDFSMVTFIDSATFRHVVEVHRFRGVRIVAVSPTVRRMFERTNLTGILDGVG